MLRTIIGLALLAALAITLSLSAHPAIAQFANPDQEKVNKSANEQIDQQYKSTLNKTRNGKPAGEAKVDPWSNVRAPEAPKPKR